MTGPSQPAVGSAPGQGQQQGQGGDGPSDSDVTSDEVLALLAELDRKIDEHFRYLESL